MEGGAIWELLHTGAALLEAGVNVYLQSQLDYRAGALIDMNVKSASVIG